VQFRDLTHCLNVCGRRRGALRALIERFDANR
jgi:hypothetical protein